VQARSRRTQAGAGTEPNELDRLGLGDRELRWSPELNRLNLSAAAEPHEPPLAAFQCTRRIDGKRPSGKLTATFVPAGPLDVELRVDFPVCGYHGSLRMAGGRLDDHFLGMSYKYRCRRSPLSMFAVSCGPYFGSELDVVVTGNGWGRSVRIHVPWTVKKPDERCEFSFDELVFDLADCAVVQ
jgi:hypothetical protein